MLLHSKLIEGAVHEIAKLPGIGKKSALRLALFLLKEKKEYTKQLTDTTCNTPFRNRLIFNVRT